MHQNTHINPNIALQIKTVPIAYSFSFAYSFSLDVVMTGAPRFLL